MATKIEWCDETWNFITGCIKCSPACDHCYAERMSKRLAGRYGYPADDPFRVTLHPDKLAQPLSWKKPKRIFVVSMGDLFHPSVPNEYIAVAKPAPAQGRCILTGRDRSGISVSKLGCRSSSRAGGSGAETTQIRTRSAKSTSMVCGS